MSRQGSSDKTDRSRAIALFLLLMGILAGCSHRQAPGGNKAYAAKQSLIQDMERRGILRAADHTRLMEITTHIEQQQAISNGDLDFWISMLHKGPIESTPDKWGAYYALVLEDALGRKQLSPDQQRKMYEAVLPFVSDAAYVKTIDPAGPQMSRTIMVSTQELAVQLLAQTRDRRALDVLKHIAQSSPSPELRQKAHEYHDKLAAAVG